jgi:hypothetical protein
MIFTAMKCWKFVIFKYIKRRAVSSTVSNINECTPENFRVGFGQTEEKRKRIVKQSSEFVFSCGIIAKICSRRAGVGALASHIHKSTAQVGEPEREREIKNSTRSEREREKQRFKCSASLSFSFGNIMLLERGYYILEICPYDFFQRRNFLLLLLDVCVSSLARCFLCAWILPCDV